MGLDSPRPLVGDRGVRERGCKGGAHCHRWEVTPGKVGAGLLAPEKGVDGEVGVGGEASDRSLSWWQ